MFAGETLYSNQLVRSRGLQVGDAVRVRRHGDTFIWQSCCCSSWGMPDGPVPPHLEKACLEHASCQDRRFLSFSKSCHLGLRRDLWYSGEVLRIHDGLADVRYTESKEWADGASGFTNSQGGSMWLGEL